MNWRVDPNLLDAATLRLRLTTPIRIAYFYQDESDPETANKCGFYKAPTEDIPKHRISLCATLDAAKANETLWHELQHARQHEEEEGLFMRLYNNEPSYSNNKFERDALEAELQNYHYTIVVPIID